MEEDRFSYDVAFSFLQADEALAYQINDQLQDSLKTFIYSKTSCQVEIGYRRYRGQVYIIHLGVALFGQGYPAAFRL